MLKLALNFESMTPCASLRGHESGLGAEVGGKVEYIGLGLSVRACFGRDTYTIGALRFLPKISFDTDGLLKDEKFLSILLLYDNMQ